MKRILILSAGIGSGHNSAAGAVAESLKAADSSAVICVTDIMEECSGKQTKLIYKYGYAASMSIIPGIYDRGYYAAQDGSEHRRGNAAVLHAAEGMTQSVYKRIRDISPDVIYCTHFFPAITATILRKRYDLGFRIILSNLDYNVTPYWNSASDADIITVAHRELIPDCIRMGFDESRIFVTGIPTKEAFLLDYDKASVRGELGLDADMFTILVMFGGGDWAGAHRIVQSLIKCGLPCQVIVINGRNKRSFDAVEKMTIPDSVKLVNIGYTDKVEKYMAASDAAVTKAGGISTTEMINIGLPMIISRKSYGQERLNLEFLAGHNACLSYRGDAELRQCLGYCRENGNELVSGMIKLRTDAAKTIAELILKQITEENT